MEYVIDATNLKKKYKGFELNLPQFRVQQGYVSALIGENGAGKTTLLDILSGIRLDYKGDITFFGNMTDKEREQKNCPIKERTGYIGPGNYYLPQWSIQQVATVSGLLFEDFHEDIFWNHVMNLGIIHDRSDANKKVTKLSDGNRMKLMLSGIMARDTDLWIMDEPASPLDPLMRDKLCEIMRDYMEKGAGKKSIFFSTHNITDMENVTDYAIIMSNGQIAEEGFVEDLKEKYVLVKGETKDAQYMQEIMCPLNQSHYGFEGIVLATQVDALAGYDVELERPNLSQISIAVIKENKL